MRKGTSKTSTPQYLPSLLDRVTNNDYIDTTLETSRQKVKTLEKKLSSKNQNITPDDKKNWLDELKTQRGQLRYLEQSVGSLNSISECVKRDLTWLFNTTNLCEDDLLSEKYSEVQSSVLNFGLPDLTGRTASSINVIELEEELKQTILRFEPRILPNTLEIRLHEDSESMDHNSLIFEISGDIWTDPVPVQLHVMTQMDLESGNIEVKDL